METEVNIPDRPFKLELSTDGSGNSIAMIRSTKSGKSFALSYILQHYFKEHIGVLMTNSPQANIYRTMKHLTQSPEYFPKVLKDMEYINEHTANEYKFLAVLDDVVTGVKFDKQILRMLCIGRNKGMSACICAGLYWPETGAAACGADAGAVPGPPAGVGGGVGAAPCGGVPGAPRMPLMA